MTTISDELALRLESMEDEQNRLDNLLNELQENELAFCLGSVAGEQNCLDKQPNEIPENDLAFRLENVEGEQNRLNDLLNELHELETQISQLKTKLKPENDAKISLNLTNNESSTNKKQNTILASNLHYDTDGYVVCLMLNPKSPPEWSGKEWHISGKGKCYKNPEQAHQCVQQLQKRWPDYPIQVLKR